MNRRRRDKRIHAKILGQTMYFTAGAGWKNNVMLLTTIILSISILAVGVVLTATYTGIKLPILTGDIPPAPGDGVVTTPVDDSINCRGECGRYDYDNSYCHTQPTCNLNGGVHVIEGDAGCPADSDMPTAKYCCCYTTLNES